MHFILDRRSTKGNSSENRQKFLKRVRHVIRDSMHDTFKNKSIKDIGKDGQDIVIDTKKIGKSLEEPSFNYDRHGDETWVMPGNDQYSQGDLVEKPHGGSGGAGGKQASDGDEQSEDPFIIHLTEAEFTNFFFEDLELPDLVKKDLNNIETVRYRNAGYSTSGSPAKMSVVRSLKQSLMRRFALQSPYRSEMNDKIDLLANTQTTQEQSLLEQDIAELQRKINSVPFLDEIDLRYRNTQKETVPSTSATMICIMDNSGSMGEREKTLSRKFFYLLYLFLNRKYKKIELIFIHHTTIAREVSEQEFFNMRESGGTIVSSALQLTSDIIKERGLDKTNLYICQCSDGDNMGSEDNQKCINILNNDILPSSQYYAYIQIQPELSGSFHQRNTDTYSLWRAYNHGIKQKHFAQQLIYNQGDIFQVFRNLFEKKTKKA